MDSSDEEEEEVDLEHEAKLVFIEQFLLIKTKHEYLRNFITTFYANSGVQIINKDEEMDFRNLMFKIGFPYLYRHIKLDLNTIA